MLRRGPVVGTAAAIVTVLALAHYGAAVYGIGRPGFEIPAPIRLGTELNISTWFSSAMHLTNAALLALIAANSVRRERWRWILLSLSCAVVAMDETAANHEQVGWIIHTTFGTSGFLTYAWIIPAVAVVAVVAALSLPMVLRRPGAWLVVAGAAVFLLGAPMIVVGALSVNSARVIRDTALSGQPLRKFMHRHRIMTQFVGMIAIFVTALWGMYQNMTYGALGQ